MDMQRDLKDNQFYEKNYTNTKLNTELNINNMNCEKNNETVTDNDYKCNCGKSYRMFKNYKSHYVKYKCPVQIIITTQTAQTTSQPTSQPTSQTTNILLNSQILDVNIIPNANDFDIIGLSELDELDKLCYNPILKSNRQLINGISNPSPNPNTNPNHNPNPSPSSSCNSNFSPNNQQINENNSSNLLDDLLDSGKLGGELGGELVNNNPSGGVGMGMGTGILDTNILDMSILDTNNKYAECVNCKLRLLKKNMRRHQSNNCKTSKELLLKQQLEAARNILSEYNNILVNNGIIGSNNVINDNRQIINVAINCITEEAKEHLTDKTKIEIVGKIFTAFDCLLDHIYKDDRNKNIYYLGNGKKEVKYISATGEVNVGDADNVIGNIAMSHLNYLDELIDTHRDSVPKPYQKTIDQLINFHSSEDCNPGYIKKTGQKIMSFRDYAKSQVKRYEQEYIDKHTVQIEL